MHLHPSITMRTKKKKFKREILEWRSEGAFEIADSRRGAVRSSRWVCGGGGGKPKHCN